MRKLALDVGNSRIGVAVSQGSLSLPHSAIQNNDEALKAIDHLVEEYSPVCIYVGLPLSLSGSHTQSTKMALDFARQVSARTSVPVRLIDERLTSRSASVQLRSAGKNSRQQKAIIDASAAALILEFAINAERDGFSGLSLEEADA